MQSAAAATCVLQLLHNVDFRRRRLSFRRLLVGLDFPVDKCVACDRSYLAARGEHGGDVLLKTDERFAHVLQQHQHLQGAEQWVHTYLELKGYPAQQLASTVLDDLYL